MLDRAGHVGGEICKDGYCVGEVEPGADILGSILEDDGRVSRHRSEDDVQVFSPVLDVVGANANWNRLRRMRRQGSDEFRVCREDDGRKRGCERPVR
jgi:hypothetical protein